ncbi:MAG: hypothetical protein ATN31_08055 [Candidatus Epulonipiscioides saccharophilum]|nr:MAG: hypothetical protein ATN31_08055 [Epulopiscium sp. AS2M-Bin001]
MKNIKGNYYHGFEVKSFIYKEREAFLIKPKVMLKDSKWIWRTEFLGGFDTVDIEMLNRGYYLAYYKIPNLYGSPEAVELMNDFYEMITSKFSLNKKVILFGFSRGALYAMNFAEKYANYVDSIYLDAPVLDIKSWPGGLFNGTGSRTDYHKCLKCYDLHTYNVFKFKSNPLDKLEFLIKHKIPLAIVAGDSDTVVPINENASILVNFCRKNDLPHMYIVKPGCNHHPHSLADPMVIANFLDQREQ